MKRSLATTCVLLVGFVLGIAFLGTVLHVRALSPPAATQNGDTNGDGERDISDVVYLLQFLFTGGADIAQISCPDTVSTTLVTTGQTRCLGEAGFIDCGLAKARGQDAAYGLGCPLEGRFVDNGDGTITDNCTRLMWTKKNVDVDGDGEQVYVKDAKTWLQACQFAEDMTFAGHDDWRVPNINEAVSIMDFGTVAAAAAGPYPVFEFMGTWTSSHDGGGRGLAIGLSLLTMGYSCDCCLIRNAYPDNSLYFSAVRGPVSQ